MSKEKSALIPKAWAAFSDALDEASTEAARQIVEQTVRDSIRERFVFVEPEE